jgi:hypothetical protein
MWHAWERTEKCTRFWWGKPEGKTPLGRPRRRWEDGIRMDLRETGLGGYGLDSTGSGQGPVAGCCECGDEPSGSYATELVSISANPRAVSVQPEVTELVLHTISMKIGITYRL